jgi:hypothetical protein
MYRERNRFSLSAPIPAPGPQSLRPVATVAVGIDTPDQQSFAPISTGFIAAKAINS